MVLETTWHAPTGWLVVHDLLVMGRIGVGRRREDYRRAPAGVGPLGILCRLDDRADSSMCTATTLPDPLIASGANGQVRVPRMPPLIGCGPPALPRAGMRRR